MLNIELIRATHRKITEAPNQHKQSTWLSLDTYDREPDLCRTTACVAGWASLLSERCDVQATLELLVYEYKHDGSEYDQVGIVCIDGTSERVDLFATKELGVTDEFADLLFLPNIEHSEVVHALELLLKEDEDAAFNYLHTILLSRWPGYVGPRRSVESGTG